MLIKMRISNFLSFGKMQEFSMLSGKVRGKNNHLYINKNIKLLCLSTIYGANAGGKSNFVKALEFAQRTIVNGFPKGTSTKYNRANKENINKPSLFEFEILLDKKCYLYGFEVLLNKESIISEYLYEMKSGNNKLEIYTRDIVNKEYKIGNYFKNSDVISLLNVHFQGNRTLDSLLFLSEMNKNKPDLYTKPSELLIFKNIFNWFNKNLDINYPDRPFSDYSYFMTKSNVDKICETIKLFGTGITNYNIISAKRDEINTMSPSFLQKITDKIEKEISISKKNNTNPDEIKMLIRSNKEFYIFEVNQQYEIEIKTIEFQHGEYGTYNLSEESDGTRRLLELIEILLSDNENKIYFIDEIDRSLHSLLTYRFIELFIESLKKRNVQLIVTTHESRLLNLNLLRRDEIWFINKNHNGESELYSLEQYNERFDKRIDKAYLSGRYNAIPDFNEV